MILLIVCICAGCSEAPYTGSQKLAMGAYIAAAAADMVTTREMLQRGYEERNPILGRDPTDQTLILSNILAFGLLYGAGELLPEHRETIWWSAAGVRGGLAIHNERLK